MDFVENVGDTTNLPVFVCGGVARAEIVDNCYVRLTLLRVPDPGAEAAHINECQLIWSIPAWCSARAALQQLADLIGTLGLNISMETGILRAARVNLIHH